MDVGVCPGCFEKLRAEDDAVDASVARDRVGESIIKLQEAKTRIRGPPSRSGSGAEPPAHKKPNVDEPPPSPTAPKKYEKTFFPRTSVPPWIQFQPHVGCYFGARLKNGNVKLTIRQN